MKFEFAQQCPMTEAWLGERRHRRACWSAAYNATRLWLVLSAVLSACAPRVVSLPHTAQTYCLPTEAPLVSVPTTLDAGATSALALPVDEPAAHCEPSVELSSDYAWESHEALEPYQFDWQTFRPCTPQSSAMAEARSMLERLNQTFQHVAANAPLEPLREQLRQLLYHRCFALSILFRNGPEGQSVAGLQLWWSEGGYAWLSALLEPPRDPPSNGRPGDLRMWFPPSERLSLSRETHGQGPLASVLCGARDEQCGAQSARWRLKAEQLLRGRDAREALNNYSRRAATQHDFSPSNERCAALARRGRVDTRFANWVSCMQDQVEQQHSALPLGHFRLPLGWLLIEGRRGHYSFCDELRAYHLDSGSVYIARRCERLFHFRTSSQATLDGGTPPPVDAGASTEDGYEFLHGILPADALREAALSILLASAVRDDQSSEAGRILPPALPLRLPGPMTLSWAGRGSWASSAQTILHWRWFDGGCERAHGRLIWPNSSDAGMTVAAELLAQAETGPMQQAPTAPLPAWILREPTVGGVSPIDASPAQLLDTRRTLLSVLRANAVAR